MKINVWTYFVNIVGSVAVLFGIVTIGTTYKMYDNYSIAVSEYRMIEQFNKAKANDPNFPMFYENKFMTYFQMKYKFIDTTLQVVNSENITSFTTLNSYLDFLNNKETSFIYNEEAIKEIQANTETATFKLAVTEIYRYWSQKDGQDEIVNGYTIPDDFKNVVLKNYNNGSFFSVYCYNAAPENISTISGLLFSIGGLLTIIGYWLFFIYRIKKEIHITK